MNLIKDWLAIRAHFNKSIRSSLHVSIASVGTDNKPTVTPVGSLFLNGDQTGFYFEIFVSKLPLHEKQNKNICVLAVNSNKWVWLKALFKLKFKSNPAIKLYGQLGNRRPATDIEISRLERRMKATKGLKGHNYLWGNMAIVREIKFMEAEGANLGKMAVQ